MSLDRSIVGRRYAGYTTSWTRKDTLLYALGVGAGAINPTGFELEFTTDNSLDVEQKVLPTFGLLQIFAAIKGMGVEDDLGDIRADQLLHGEQQISFNGPIPPEGRVDTTTVIRNIYDRGSGALVVVDSEARYPDGSPAFSASAGLFVRGEGGWGGERGPPPSVFDFSRQPDLTTTYQVRPDQTLLYRLSGDFNPLHSDPKLAAAAGFRLPIVHGQCTYGFTARALLHQLCNSDPGRFLSLQARFTRPVFPGDQLTISTWYHGVGEAIFQTSNQHGGIVLDGGLCRYVS